MAEHQRPRRSRAPARDRARRAVLARQRQRPGAHLAGAPRRQRGGRQQAPVAGRLARAQPDEQHALRLHAARVEHGRLAGAPAEVTGAEQRRDGAMGRAIERERGPREFRARAHGDRQHVGGARRERGPAKGDVHGDLLVGGRRARGRGIAQKLQPRRMPAHGRAPGPAPAGARGSARRLRRATAPGNLRAGRADSPSSSTP